MQLGSAALKDEGAGHGLDADLLDGQDGSYYLAYGNLTGRPRSFLVPGQIVVMASPHPPAGMFLCNGAAVSRTEYLDLFNAIGTTYGAGDGATTFNLPRFSGGQTALHSERPEIVGRNSAGEVISHTHSASASAVGIMRITPRSPVMVDTTMALAATAQGSTRTPPGRMDRVPITTRSMIRGTLIIGPAPIEALIRAVGQHRTPPRITLFPQRTRAPASSSALPLTTRTTSA